MTEFSGYEDGYAVGFDSGYDIGYSEGLTEVNPNLEIRIAALFTEIMTLTARVDYLERHTGLSKES